MSVNQYFTKFYFHQKLQIHYIKAESKLVDFQESLALVMKPTDNN